MAQLDTQLIARSSLGTEPRVLNAFYGAPHSSAQLAAWSVSQLRRQTGGLAAHRDQVFVIHYS